MPSNIYTGQVQGVSLIATGTPSAFCREVLSGTFNRNPNNSRRRGIGGQVAVRKGIDEITLDLTCIGIDKDELALWFPTTAGVIVASFPDFLVEVDDGTNGQEFVLSGGQPSSITMSLGDGPDAQVEYRVAMRFALATEAAAGTDVPVYNAYLGHGSKDCHVQIGAADHGIMSWELSNDLGSRMVNTLDAKSTSAMTAPLGCVITTQNQTFRCVTTEVYKGTVMDGDEWTPEDVVIELDNGTTAEDITATLHDFVPEAWNMPLEAEGVVGFAHDFGPAGGNVFNRVTFA